MKTDDDRVIDGYLPAVVIGYEASARVSALESVQDPPPWLTWWHHQYGGLACLQASFAGLVLPLETAPALSDKAEVLKVLDGFGHDSRGAVPRLPDALSELAWSLGRAYTHRQLLLLDRLLTRGFDVPPLKAGAEAFVEFESADWSGAFNAWPVVTYEIPEQSTLTDPDSVHLIMGPRQVTPLHCLDEALLADVRRFFTGLGFPGPLCAYLVWFNSD